MTSYSACEHFVCGFRCLFRLFLCARRGFLPLQVHCIGRDWLHRGTPPFYSFCEVENGDWEINYVAALMMLPILSATNKKLLDLIPGLREPAVSW